MINSSVSKFPVASKPVEPEEQEATKRVTAANLNGIFFIEWNQVSNTLVTGSCFVSILIEQQLDLMKNQVFIGLVFCVQLPQIIVGGNYTVVQLRFCRRLNSPTQFNDFSIDFDQFLKFGDFVRLLFQRDFRVEQERFFLRIQTLNIDIEQLFVVAQAVVAADVPAHSQAADIIRGKFI